MPSHLPIYIASVSIGLRHDQDPETISRLLDSQLFLSPSPSDRYARLSCTFVDNDGGKGKQFIADRESFKNLLLRGFARGDWIVLLNQQIFTR